MEIVQLHLHASLFQRRSDKPHNCIFITRKENHVAKHIQRDKAETWYVCEMFCFNIVVENTKQMQKSIYIHFSLAATVTESNPPDFIQALQITKTRAGMQVNKHNLDDFRKFAHFVLS